MQHIYLYCLKNTAGSIITSPKEIVKLLADYYTSLYSENLIELKVADALLAKVHLLKLTATQLEVLNALISLDNNQLTIKSLALCKSPGPNGYTTEFYKLTKDFIPDTIKHVLEYHTLHLYPRKGNNPSPRLL